MQRVLLILGVIALVMASLAAGTLAAHWPFWQRAWQWHVSDTGWPARIDGATRGMRGGDSALALDIRSDLGVTAIAATATTQALLLARADGTVDAWFARGVDAQSVLDGRGLTAVVLAPLFAQFASEQAGMLDKPLGTWLPEWRREDRRGTITPRQLFWQLSGMPAGTMNPLNPFNRRAQLAAGPDFTRAALRWQPVWPAGSHFEESPVNAQLLALVAARFDGGSFAEVLQRRIWSRVAAHEAQAMLDHRDGDMAAHCCLRAALGDWLRLALLLASDGRIGGSSLWSPGFLAQLATASPVHEGQGLGFQLFSPHAEQQLLVAASAGRRLMIAPQSGAALLWIGEGEPPPGLARLLP